MGITEAQSLTSALQAATPQEVVEAANAEGYQIFKPGDVPGTAWKRMRGWQILTLLIVMYGALVAIFFFLIIKGADLSKAKDTATIGGTMIGGALALIGAGAVGAAATGKASG